LDGVINGRSDYKKEIRYLKKYLEINIGNLVFLDRIFNDIVISRIQEARDENDERVYGK
jgi:hypothetical protein